MHIQEPNTSELPATPTPELAAWDGLIGRRRLLQMLAATAGAVAVETMVPTEWIAPVLQIGVLPVHALTSIPVSTPSTPVPPAGPTPTATVTVEPTATLAPPTGPTPTDAPVEPTATPTAPAP